MSFYYKIYVVTVLRCKQVSSNTSPSSIEYNTPPNRNMESNYSNLAIWPMLCIGVTTFYVQFFICSTTKTAKFDFLAEVGWLTA